MSVFFEAINGIEQGRSIPFPTDILDTGLGENRYGAITAYADGSIS